ncbi:MAG: hypothetical protein U1F58_10555 [Burkholderiales bacterium]
MRFRRHRRRLASLFLGAWLFALFVGIAHAHVVDAQSHATAAVATTGTDSGDDCDTDGCRQFCDNDTPIVAKVKPLQDPPADHAAAVPTLGIRDAPPPGIPAAAGRHAHPPARVPVILRTLRLAL